MVAMDSNVWKHHVIEDKYPFENWKIIQGFDENISQNKNKEQTSIDVLRQLDRNSSQKKLEDSKSESMKTFGTLNSEINDDDDSVRHKKDKKKKNKNKAVNKRLKCNDKKKKKKSDRSRDNSNTDSESASSEDTQSKTDQYTYKDMALGLGKFSRKIRDCFMVGAVDQINDDLKNLTNRVKKMHLDNDIDCCPQQTDCEPRCCADKKTCETNECEEKKPYVKVDRPVVCFPLDQDPAQYLYKENSYEYCPICQEAENYYRERMCDYEDPYQAEPMAAEPPSPPSPMQQSPPTVPPYTANFQQYPMPILPPNFLPPFMFPMDMGQADLENPYGSFIQNPLLPYLLPNLESIDIFNKKDKKKRKKKKKKKKCSESVYDGIESTHPSERKKKWWLQSKWSKTAGTDLDDPFRNFTKGHIEENIHCPCCQQMRQNMTACCQGVGQNTAPECTKCSNFAKSCPETPTPFSIQIATHSGSKSKTVANQFPGGNTAACATTNQSYKCVQISLTSKNKKKRKKKINFMFNVNELLGTTTASTCQPVYPAEENNRRAEQHFEKGNYPPMQDDLKFLQDQKLFYPKQLASDNFSTGVQTTFDKCFSNKPNTTHLFSKSTNTQFIPVFENENSETSQARYVEVNKFSGVNTPDTIMHISEFDTPNKPNFSSAMATPKSQKTPTKSGESGEVNPLYSFLESIEKVNDVVSTLQSKEMQRLVNLLSPTTADKKVNISFPPSNTEDEQTAVSVSEYKSDENHSNFSFVCDRSESNNCIRSLDSEDKQDKKPKKSQSCRKTTPYFESNESDFNSHGSVFGKSGPPTPPIAVPSERDEKVKKYVTRYYPQDFRACQNSEFKDDDQKEPCGSTYYKSKWNGSFEPDEDACCKPPEKPTQFPNDFEKSRFYKYFPQSTVFNDWKNEKKCRKCSKRGKCTCEAKEVDSCEDDCYVLVKNDKRQGKLYRKCKAKTSPSLVCVESSISCKRKRCNSPNTHDCCQEKCEPCFSKETMAKVKSTRAMWKRKEKKPDDFAQQIYDQGVSLVKYLTCPEKESSISCCGPSDSCDSEDVSNKIIYKKHVKSCFKPKKRKSGDVVCFDVVEKFEPSDSCDSPEEYEVKQCFDAYEKEECLESDSDDDCVIIKNKKCKPVIKRKIKTKKVLLSEKPTTIGYLKSFKHGKPVYTKLYAEKDALECSESVISYSRTDCKDDEMFDCDVPIYTKREPRRTICKNKVKNKTYVDKNCLAFSCPPRKSNSSALCKEFIPSSESSDTSLACSEFVSKDSLCSCTRTKVIKPGKTIEKMKCSNMYNGKPMVCRKCKHISRKCRKQMNEPKWCEPLKDIQDCETANSCKEVKCKQFIKQLKSLEDMDSSSEIPTISTIESSSENECCIKCKPPTYICTEKCQLKEGKCCNSGKLVCERKEEEFCIPKAILKGAFLSSSNRKCKCEIKAENIDVCLKKPIEKCKACTIEPCTEAACTCKCICQKKEKSVKDCKCKVLESEEDESPVRQYNLFYKCPKLNTKNRDKKLQCCSVDTQTCKSTPTGILRCCNKCCSNQNISKCTSMQCCKEECNKTVINPGNTVILNDKSPIFLSNCQKECCKNTKKVCLQLPSPPCCKGTQVDSCKDHSKTVLLESRSPQCFLENDTKVYTILKESPCIEQYCVKPETCMRSGSTIILRSKSPCCEGQTKTWELSRKSCSPCSNLIKTETCIDRIDKIVLKNDKPFIVTNGSTVCPQTCFTIKKAESDLNCKNTILVLNENPQCCNRCDPCERIKSSCAQTVNTVCTENSEPTSICAKPVMKCPQNCIACPCQTLPLACEKINQETCESLAAKLCLSCKKPCSNCNCKVEAENINLSCECQSNEVAIRNCLDDLIKLYLKKQLKKYIKKHNKNCNLSSASSTSCCSPSDSCNASCDSINRKNDVKKWCKKIETVARKLSKVSLRSKKSEENILKEQENDCKKYYTKDELKPFLMSLYCALNNYDYLPKSNDGIVLKTCLESQKLRLLKTIADVDKDITGCCPCNFKLQNMSNFRKPSVSYNPTENISLQYRSRYYPNKYSTKSPYTDSLKENPLSQFRSRLRRLDNYPAKNGNENRPSSLFGIREGNCYQLRHEALGCKCFNQSHLLSTHPEPNTETNLRSTFPESDSDKKPDINCSRYTDSSTKLLNKKLIEVNEKTICSNKSSMLPSSDCPKLCNGSKEVSNINRSKSDLVISLCQNNKSNDVSNVWQTLYCDKNKTKNNSKISVIPEERDIGWNTLDVSSDVSISSELIKTKELDIEKESQPNSTSKSTSVFRKTKVILVKMAEEKDQYFDEIDNS